ncbi:MAG: sugar ABC transporter permease [Acidimicrobiia bacterium]
MTNVEHPPPGATTPVEAEDQRAVAATEEHQTELATTQAELAVAPEIVADTLGEYVRAWLARVRGGESGVLPVVVGLVVISAIFQSQNSKFLSSGNLTNLLVQSAVFMLLGMAEVFPLVLGEIDLSIGFVSGIGGIVMAELVIEPRSWPWWAAILVAVATTAAIGALQGTIITRLRLPSFVVTLAGLLFWEGVMLLMLGEGGTVPIPNNVINNLANGNLTPTAGWIAAVVIVGVFALVAWFRDAHRRASGLVAPPVGLTIIKIGGVAAAAIALLFVCNTNRGALVTIRGVPWVVLIVLGVLAAWTLLLGRTRYGRYMYAIGGNPEAARRAGVNLAMIRTTAFMLSGLTAGIAGIIYASRLRSVSTSLDGGTLVLYSVAAAVIGGASLFGGRGKAVHAVLGGIVIASIYNGMGLLGMSAASQYMITALVLLAAVTVDALARRGRAVATTTR